MRLAIIGTGHVGLVTGASFAELGNEVICVDNDQSKIEGLQRGVIPIFEPGLQDLVHRNQDNGRLRFTGDIVQGVEDSEVIFICVNTPSKPDGSADLSSVEAVSREIARCTHGYKVVVEKSTVPVETGEWVQRTLRLYNRNGAEFDVVSMPEFLREGSAVEDSLHPDRIVVGVESARAEAVIRKLMRAFTAPIVVTDIKSAELIKHASNSFLAMKISYINAIATICDQVGADVAKVAEGMGYDRRIGKEFLAAGVGYGGACFPKDVAAFIRLAEDAGYDFRLLKAVQEINTQQRSNLVKKLKRALWVLQGKTVGVLGLAFKPNTDDMRGAPSIDIISMLQREGAAVKVYDPGAMEVAKQVLDSQVRYCQDPYQVAEDAHALAILTDWKEFKDLDWLRMKELLAIPIVIDGRNIYDPRRMRELGFEYYAIGRQ